MALPNDTLVLGTQRLPRSLVELSPVMCFLAETEGVEAIPLPSFVHDDADYLRAAEPPSSFSVRAPSRLHAARRLYRWFVYG